jgi:hypothetical protein
VIGFLDDMGAASADELGIVYSLPLAQTDSRELMAVSSELMAEN